MEKLIIGLAIFFIPLSVLGQQSHYKIGMSVDPDLHYDLGSSLFSIHFAYQPGLVGFYTKLGGSAFSYIPSRNDYYDNISKRKAEEVYGDQQTSKAYTHLLFAAGASIQASKNINLVAAPSITLSDLYYQYKDPTYILSDSGHYWVDAEESITTFGGYIATNISVNKGWAVHLSLNTNPSIFGIGLTYSFTPQENNNH